MTDAVTRFLHSPLYSGPLLNFIDTNCITFENGEQNKLAYTTIHENFKQLVDGLISDFLKTLGISVTQFVQMLAKHRNEAMSSIVVAAILAVDDFLLFKEMMQKRNKQLLNQGKTLNKELRGYASLDDCGRHTIVAAPYIKKVYSHPKEEGKRYRIPYYYTLYNLSLQDSHKSRFPAQAQA
ncbi:unnamed protein product [Sphagnum jensenii]|uniref:Cilia- and flagella-associated protein 36 n=1 Tax=Sphagnum jensenii TaxID=128206 RepID=A0ABP0WQ69_9BRYO